VDQFWQKPHLKVKHLGAILHVGGEFNIFNYYHFRYVLLWPITTRRGLGTMSTACHLKCVRTCMGGSFSLWMCFVIMIDDLAKTQDHLKTDIAQLFRI